MATKASVRIIALVVFSCIVAPTEAYRLLKKSAQAPALVATKTNIPYRDAKPILEAFRTTLPAELGARPSAELESRWPGWVSRRDAAIRARLKRGDEDSLVNLLLFGTTFTSLPRVTNEATERGGQSRAAKILEGRIDDMVAGIAMPGANERLRFAHRLVESKGIATSTASGPSQIRSYLLDIMTRVSKEVDGYAQTIESWKALENPSSEFWMRSRLYRTRGLSSDTSIRPAFAVEHSLQAIRSKHMLADGTVRRVALIGPGLDFTDKAEGYDFYPEQTIQPFAVIDSLIRLRLANANELQLTTFDLSSRVNMHLDTARRLARTGAGYVLQLPLNNDVAWTPGLATYWTRYGDMVAEQVTAITPPPTVRALQTRAVRVRPAIVMSILPLDLNIVLQRLEPLAPDQLFDLIIATNVLVYYDVFEQVLSLANIATMLRPLGLFLTNNAVMGLSTTPLESVGHSTVVYSDRPNDSDRIIWYQRQ